MAVNSVLAVFTISSVLTRCTILSWSAVHAILSVLAMIDGHIAAFAETDSISDDLSVFIDRFHTGYIIIVLKGINDCLKRFDVGIHLIYLCSERLESVPCRQFDLSAVSQGNDDVRRVRRTVYILEKRISLVAFITFVALWSLVTLWSLLSLLTLVSGCRANVFPCLTTIHRYIPVTIHNLQLRSHSILTRLSLWSLRTSFALRTLWTLRTGCTVYANGLDLIAILIQKPLTVKSPVVQTICILPYADLRGIAILSVSAISTISTILTMIYGYSSALVKSDLISDFLAIFNDRHNTSHIILRLKSKNHGLECLDVGICLITESIQTGIDIVDLLMDLRKFIPIDILATHKQHTSKEDNVKNLLHKFLC